MRAILPNSFANYGSIIFGDDFLGRSEAIKQLEERVIMADEPGCTCIIGLPKIGKSSLAWQTLIYPKQSLLSQKKIPMWISMGVYQTPEDFFKQLIQSAVEELEEIGDLNEIQEKIAGKALEPGLHWSEFQHQIKRFIRSVRREGWRLIYVIDEFDAAKSIFKDSLYAFQALRELNNNPDSRICYVTTSRRTIPDIEVKSDISNLQGIFHDIFLGMFSEEEFEKQLNPFKQLGFNFDESFYEKIRKITGRHPYLTAALRFQLAHQWLNQKNIDISEAQRILEVSYFDYYRKIINMFEGNNLNILFEVAEDLNSFNPFFEEYDRLSRYGLVCKQDGQTRFFSEHFHNYLRGVEHPQLTPENMEKGRLIEGRFRVLKLLKPTRHSQVIKAWDEKIERNVAIKRLYISNISKKVMDEYKERLEREGCILADLHHPNIGEVFTTLQEIPALVMEWVEGESLQDILENGRILSTPDILKIGIAVSDALHYIHTHVPPVIHRDIKPGNIIFSNQKVPILIDFGISRTNNRETISHTEQGRYLRMGTGRYSAPEQLLDPEHVTPKADIFSLGVSLYEMVTGEMPYKWGNNPEDYDDNEFPSINQGEIPDRLFLVLCKTLSQDPKQRPNAEELKNLLSGNRNQE